MNKRIERCTMAAAMAVGSMAFAGILSTVQAGLPPVQRQGAVEYFYPTPTGKMLLKGYRPLGFDLGRPTLRGHTFLSIWCAAPAFAGGADRSCASRACRRPRRRCSRARASRTRHYPRRRRLRRRPPTV